MKTWMHYFVDFGPWGGGSTSIHFCVIAPFRAHAQTLSKNKKKTALRPDTKIEKTEAETNETG